MLIFISGGVRSGKSTLGEKFSHELAKGRKIYLATSIAYDEEMVKRIEIHKAQRLGKGFITIEKSRNIGDVANNFQKDDTILLDCLGNLLANEMFGNETIDHGETITDRIFEAICDIDEKTDNLIIVSNDVFSDGCMYSDSVVKYIDILAELHKKIVSISDEAIECVAGNIVLHKACI